MRRTVFLETSESSRLDDFLRVNLPSATEDLAEATGSALSNSKIRRLILSGNVFAYGRAVRNPSLVLGRRVRVKVLVDSERLFFERRNNDVEFSLGADCIVFEDEWLLAVDKPCGLPSEGTFLEKRASLLDAARDYLREKNNGADVYCVLAHRLDRCTSGVMLLCKSKAASAALHGMFAGGSGRSVRKAYLAVCSEARVTAGSACAFLRSSASGGDEARGRRLEDEFSVGGFLGRVSKKASAAKFGEVSEENGGKFSRTDFQVLERSAGRALVLARPLTGRTHQIRAHLSQCHMPILGDTLYGGEAAWRVFLHARCLELPHPFTGEPLRLLAPVPKEFADLFTNCAEYT